MCLISYLCLYYTKPKLGVSIFNRLSFIIVLKYRSSAIYVWFLQVNFPNNTAVKTVRAYVRSARGKVTTASVIMLCAKMLTVLNVQPIHSANREKNSREQVREDRLLSSQLYIML